MQEISKLMGKGPDALGFLQGVLGSHPGIPLVTEFSDGIGDRVAQAPVQRAELVGRKRGIALMCQVGNGLT